MKKQDKNTKQQLFEMMSKLNKTFKQKLNENFGEEESIPQEPEELTEANGTGSPINKYVYFALNYPHDFIEEIWADDQNLANNLRSKFKSYYDPNNTYGTMNRFYVNLDDGNQQKLENWILANYNGGIQENDDKWIQKAVNPEHKGYCSPMTKKTCTPKRKTLAKRFKKGIEDESE